jgi:hypothetical protein
VQTVPINSPFVTPTPDVGCIPNGDISRFGTLVLNRRNYPFILVYDGSSYSTLYVDYDNDYTFCETPDNTPVNIGEWFNISDTNWILFGDADRVIGAVAYFTLNTSYQYVDFTDVGVGATGKNRLYPLTNESAYAVLVLDTKTYEVDGIVRNVAAAILNIVNETYRVAWIPTSLSGHDEWKLVRDSIVWTSRKRMFESTGKFKYENELIYPIIWSRNATIVGEAVVKIW